MDNIIGAYIIGLGILLFTFGLIMFSELRVRTALILLICYPIWLCIFLLDASFVLIKCLILDKKIEEVDFILCPFIWHKLEEKLK